ncbi:MAG: FecR domain-containing protein [Bacteroidota bacterium]
MSVSALDTWLTQPADAASLSEEQFQAALAADPKLAAAWAAWVDVAETLRTRLHDAAPQRSHLVCYALQRCGRTDALSDAERQMLTERREALEQALAAHPGLAAVVQDIEKAAADFDTAWPAPPQARTDRQPRARATNAKRWGWRISAMGSVLAFAALAVILIQRDSSQVTVATAAGETQRIELADGTLIRLAERSSLTYTPAEAESVFDRRVVLAGRAFFDVVPAQQGFVVETATAQATVLGTQFAVAATDALTEVTLTSGRVTLASKANLAAPVTLSPGEQARVARGALPSAPAPVELAQTLAWARVLAFDATPLSAIALTLQAELGASIQYDPTLADEAISGTFFLEEQSAEEIVAIIAQSLGLTATPMDDGGFRLTE